ncbi:MAG: hypothetical protein WC376_03855 [Candidatus Nanoarchaeia archaeon]|jgi:hypothetical protein
MSKSGYSLIIIGLILLAYNYSLIDFSILTGPLVLPIMLILAGSFSVFKGLFKKNDLLDVLSSFIGIILFLAIFINIFNLPLVILPNNIDSIVELNDSALIVSYASFDFSADLSTVTINYESNDKNYIESTEYLNNYSLFNSFSQSNYDFNNFLIDNLVFENNFGESTIANLASINNSILNNNFGELTIYTGNIIGEKEVVINNDFGDVKLIMDESASYQIQSDNSFGSIRNNIGLSSNNYSNATNKIKILVHNVFGTVQLSKQ